MGNSQRATLRVVSLLEWLRMLTTCFKSMSDIWLSRQRTRAEASPHVTSIRRVEISISVMNEARTRYPTTTAEHLVVPKPGRGVLSIRAGNKAGIWVEIACGPFPYVADHLPAAES